MVELDFLQRNTFINWKKKVSQIIFRREVWCIYHKKIQFKNQVKNIKLYNIEAIPENNFKINSGFVIWVITIPPPQFSRQLQYTKNTFPYTLTKKHTHMHSQTHTHSHIT